MCRCLQEIHWCYGTMITYWMVLVLADEQMAINAAVVSIMVFTALNYVDGLMSFNWYRLRFLGGSCSIWSRLWNVSIDDISLELCSCLVCFTSLLFWCWNLINNIWFNASYFDPCSVWLRLYTYIVYVGLKFLRWCCMCSQIQQYNVWLQ